MKERDIVFLFIWCSKSGSSRASCSGAWQPSVSVLGVWFESSFKSLFVTVFKFAVLKQVNEGKMKVVKEGFFQEDDYEGLLQE